VLLLVEDWLALAWLAWYAVVAVVVLLDSVLEVALLELASELLVLALVPGWVLVLGMALVCQGPPQLVLVLAPGKVRDRPQRKAHA
jgi:hypothetical protein